MTAYDGDRITAVFIGDLKNTTAARAALKINWAVRKIVQPLIAEQYPTYSYALKHVVGIDTSKLRVARTGIRGANDLVWVGRAANDAAKLSSLNDPYPTWITKAVYGRLGDKSKMSSGVNIWEQRFWTSMGDAEMYRSNYRWVI